MMSPVPCLVDYEGGRLLLSLEAGDDSDESLAELSIVGHQYDKEIDFTMELNRDAVKLLHDELGKLLRTEVAVG